MKIISPPVPSKQTAPLTSKTFNSKISAVSVRKANSGRKNKTSSQRLLCSEKSLGYLVACDSFL